jgi:hypothetical protein
MIEAESKQSMRTTGANDRYNPQSTLSGSTAEQEGVIT